MPDFDAAIKVDLPTLWRTKSLKKATSGSFGVSGGTQGGSSTSDIKDDQGGGSGFSAIPETKIPVTRVSDAVFKKNF